MITLFRRGYFGWGNHTPDLVRAADAVEAARGFGPPLFVDTRIRRAVRARGFQGPAFAHLLGDRYRWVPALGNRFILTRSGPAIQINDPAAADELLDLAVEAGRVRRRVVFFCSCQWPRDGQAECHRVEVGRLVLAAAARRRQPAEVVEWPGGEPREFDLTVESPVFRALRQGRTAVPLGEPADLAAAAGLPWGSVVTVRAGDEVGRVVSGPAFRRPHGWALPVFGFFPEGEDAERTAAELRADRDLGPHRSAEIARA